MAHTRLKLVDAIPIKQARSRKPAVHLSRLRPLVPLWRMSVGLALIALLVMVSLDQALRWLHPGVIDPPWAQWPLASVMVLVATMWLYLRRMLGPFVSPDIVPERVANAMNMLPDGVLILDQQGRILLFNEAFEKLVSPHAVKVGDLLDAHTWWCEALSLAPGTADSPWTRVLKAAVPQVRTVLPFSLGQRLPQSVRLTCRLIAARGSKVCGCLVVVAEQDASPLPNPFKEF